MAEKNPFRQSVLQPQGLGSNPFRKSMMQPVPPPIERNPFRKSVMQPSLPLAQPIQPFEKDPAHWSVEDVCQWLGSIGLSFLEQKFISEDVIGGVMLDMTEEDFVDCLALDPDHAHIICIEREKLKQNNPPQPQSDLFMGFDDPLPIGIDDNHDLEPDTAFEPLPDIDYSDHLDPDPDGYLNEDADLETVRSSLILLKQEYESKFGELPKEDLYSEEAYHVEPDPYDEELEDTERQLEELKAQYAAMMAGLDGDDEDYDTDDGHSFNEASDVERTEIEQDLYGWGTGFVKESGFAKPAPEYEDDFRPPQPTVRKAVRGTRQSLVPILDDSSNPFAAENTHFVTSAPADSDPPMRIPKPSFSKPVERRAETLCVSAPILLSGPITSQAPSQPTHTTSSQYANPFLTGETNWTHLPVPYLKMTVHNVEVKANEGVAFCKKYALYEIHIEQDGWHWIIFRRYSQFFELDKKLKSGGLLASSNSTLPPKTGLKRNNTAEAMAQRVLDFQKYFHTVINKPEVRSSQQVFMFVGPFQLGDSKPQWVPPKPNTANHL